MILYTTNNSFTILPSNILSINYKHRFSLRIIHILYSQRSHQYTVKRHETTYPTNPPRYLLIRPSSSRLIQSNHHRFTKTPHFLIENLLFFPKYTYDNNKAQSQQNTCVDEISLLPTFSWIYFHNFTDPLKIPLRGNTDDNELCDTTSHQLTTVLHLKQFTNIGLSRILNRFIARKSNHFCITHCDTQSFTTWKIHPMKMIRQ